MWLVKTVRPANHKKKGVKTLTLLEMSRRRHQSDTGHIPRDLLPGKRDAQSRADLRQFPCLLGTPGERNVVQVSPLCPSLPFSWLRNLGASCLFRISPFAADALLHRTWRETIICTVKSAGHSASGSLASRPVPPWSAGLQRGARIVSLPPVTGAAVVTTLLQCAGVGGRGHVL